MFGHMSGDSQLGKKGLGLDLALPDSKVYVLCHLSGPAVLRHTCHYSCLWLEICVLVFWKQIQYII